MKPQRPRSGTLRDRKAAKAPLVEEQAAGPAKITQRPSTPNDLLLAEMQMTIRGAADAEGKWRARLGATQKCASLTANKIHRLGLLVQLCRRAVAEIDRQVEEYLTKLVQFPPLLGVPSVASAFDGQPPPLTQQNALNDAMQHQLQLATTVVKGKTPSIVQAAEIPRPLKASKKTDAASAEDTAFAVAMVMSQFTLEPLTNSLVMALPNPSTSPSEFLAACVELITTGSYSANGTFGPPHGPAFSALTSALSAIPGGPMPEGKGRAGSARGTGAAAAVNLQRKQSTVAAPPKGAFTIPPAVATLLSTKGDASEVFWTVAADGSPKPLYPLPVIGPIGMAIDTNDLQFAAAVSLRRNQLLALTEYLRTAYRLPRLAKERAPLRPTSAVEFRQELAFGSRLATPYADAATLASTLAMAAQGNPLPNLCKGEWQDEEVRTSASPSSRKEKGAAKAQTNDPTSTTLINLLSNRSAGRQEPKRGGSAGKLRPGTSPAALGGQKEDTVVSQAMRHVFMITNEFSVADQPHDPPVVFSSVPVPSTGKKSPVPGLRGKAAAKADAVVPLDAAAVAPEDSLTIDPLLTQILAANDVETLLAQSYDLFVLPCPKTVDARLNYQVCVWRSQRLRLESCIHALEEECQPLQSRVDGMGNMSVIGRYSFSAAKQRFTNASTTETRLLQLKQREDQEFLAQIAQAQVAVVQDTKGKAGKKK